MTNVEFTEDDTMWRLWPGARLCPQRHYKWRGTREKLEGRLRRLCTEGKWLLFDPTGHIGWWGDAPASLWTLHVPPTELSRALHLASGSFRGAILVDLEALNGLWGRRGPYLELWLPIWSLCQQFTVVECAMGDLMDPG